MKMPKMGGFTKFLKAHLDTSAIGVVLAGLALPAVTFMVADRLNLSRKLSNLPVVGTALANPFGQAALGIGAMAVLNYGLVSANVMSEKTAVAAGTVAIQERSPNSSHSLTASPPRLQLADTVADT